jgi:hypothetical protein
MKGQTEIQDKILDIKLSINWLQLEYSKLGQISMMSGEGHKISTEISKLQGRLQALNWVFSKEIDEEISYGKISMETKKEISFTHMKWSDILPPNPKIPYSHVLCDTPLGLCEITWKHWKEFPDYGICINGAFIGGSNTLEGAKQMAFKEVICFYIKFSEFLGLKVDINLVL